MPLMVYLRRPRIVLREHPVTSGSIHSVGLSEEPLGTVPGKVSLRMSRRTFVDELTCWLLNFLIDSIPYVEDLLSSSNLLDFMDWHASFSNCEVRFAPPSYSANIMRGAAAAAAGRQPGAHSSRRAVYQRVAACTTKAEHLALACRSVTETPPPWARSAPLDDDLRFAARGTVIASERLRPFRQRFVN